MTARQPSTARPLDTAEDLFGGPPQIGVFGLATLICCHKFAVAMRVHAG